MSTVLLFYWRLSALSHRRLIIYLFFFFNDTATTEIYTLSLHDALPIWDHHAQHVAAEPWTAGHDEVARVQRSEEHTSELQSPCNLVCRLLLEKKKKIQAQGPNACSRTAKRT